MGVSPGEPEALYGDGTGATTDEVMRDLGDAAAALGFFTEGKRQVAGHVRPGTSGA